MADLGEGTEYIESWAKGHFSADSLPLWTFTAGLSVDW